MEFIADSLNTKQRSRRAVKADKLRTVLNLIQQHSGASQDDVSATCSPISPCAEAKGVSHDCEDQSTVQPDRSPDDMQLQLPQAGRSGGMYVLPRYAPQVFWVQCLH